VPGADPAVLASLPLFGALSESDLADVASMFEVRDVEAGVRLAGEGATGNAFFVICDGEMTVTVQGKEIDTLRAGDFFGELALLGARRRAATVTTTAPARVLVLFGDDFARLRNTCPSVAAAVDAAIEQRLRRLGSATA
jgi:CRP-like cAMP-binding protein